jgi:uncharacterized protein YgbK (DUF1537 family)
MASATTKSLIIADDLTGANDTGIQFRQQGFDTIVLTDLESFDSAFLRFDATCVDTDTRRLPAEPVLPRMEEVIRTISGRASQATIYKKVDSTLRGHIGREIDILVEKLRFECVFFAPAYPGQGRQTLNGIYLVNSVPITETEFSKDPRFPILTSEVREWMKGQSKLRSAHLGGEVISQGWEAILSGVEGHLRQGVRIFTFDCSSASDLGAIAEAGLQMKRRPLFVGSAGLAERVAEGLSSRKRGEAGCLVIAGSLSRVTSEQVRYAVENGAHLISLPDGFWSEQRKGKRMVQRIAQEASDALAEGKGVVIWTQSGEAQPTSLDAAKTDQINHFLSELTQTVMAKTEIRGLVLTGGETASAILSAFGAHGLRLEAEVLPAIPFGRIVGGSQEGLGVVTKAGGFGKPEALAKSIEFIKAL